MAHVIVLDSINEDIFVCGICKSVFNSLQIFLGHKSFKCSSSEESLINSAIVQTTAVLTDSFSTSAGIIQHIEPRPEEDAKENEQTWPKDHSCVSCKKKFKKMKSLLTHMKMHDEKPYQCPVCGRCFIQNSHLQRHITTHKIWPDGPTQNTAKTVEAELLSYSCPYCSVVLPNYSQFRAHLKNHLSLKKFKCIQGDCTEFHDTIGSLLQHVNTSHETRLYSCHICNFVFNSLEDIATHQYSHNESAKKDTKKLKLYKCSQCDAEFRKPEKLSLHMLTENHKKVCIHCNKIFASDKRLRLHLQIHKKIKTFQCNICNSSFHMKKYLSSHMLKHGNRQYKCSVCKYMFKRSDLLQRHMRLHQAKKTFKCPFKDSLDCKKEFSRSDKLKLHIKSHTKHMSMNTTTKVKMALKNNTTDEMSPP